MEVVEATANMAQSALPVINVINTDMAGNNITLRRRSSLFACVSSDKNNAWLRYLEDNKNKPKQDLDSDPEDPDLESDDYPQQYIDSLNEEIKFWNKIYLEADSKIEQINAVSSAENGKNYPTVILSQEQMDFLDGRTNYEEYIETAIDFMHHNYILMEKMKLKEQKISKLRATLEEQKKFIISMCKKQLREL